MEVLHVAPVPAPRCVLFPLTVLPLTTCNGELSMMSHAHFRPGAWRRSPLPATDSRRRRLGSRAQRIHFPLSRLVPNSPHSPRTTLPIVFIQRSKQLALKGEYIFQPTPTFFLSFFFLFFFILATPSSSRLFNLAALPHFSSQSRCLCTPTASARHPTAGTPSSPLQAPIQRSPKTSQARPTVQRRCRSTAQSAPVRQSPSPAAPHHRHPIRQKAPPKTWPRSTRPWALACWFRSASGKPPEDETLTVGNPFASKQVQSSLG